MPARGGPTPLPDQLRALIPPGPEGLVGTYDELARRLDVADDMVRDATAALRRAGRIRVRPAGQRGVRLLASESAPGGTSGPAQARCARCGAALGPSWRYCGTCGAPRPGRRPASRR